MACDCPRQFADHENAMGCAVVDHGDLRTELGCELSACEMTDYQCAWGGGPTVRFGSSMSDHVRDAGGDVCSRSIWAGYFYL